MAQQEIWTDPTVAPMTGTTGAQEVEMAQKDITGGPTTAQGLERRMATLGPTYQAERGGVGRGDIARVTDATGTGTAHGEMPKEPAAHAPPRTPTIELPIPTSPA